MGSCSVVSDSLRPHELQPTRLLCPWNFPGKNTGVGCHALLQGISLTQGSNPHLLHLLHWQAGSLPLVPPGKPLVAQTVNNLPAMQETQVKSLGREDPLEKKMGTYSSILAREIPWAEEPGGL